MAGEILTVRSLNFNEGTFNWVFLVWYFVCSILTLLFLFYFNRFFASLVSSAIRAYSWHRYHVYIDIQALQFSFLAGRIFFKGLRYHGENETVLVHDGHVTWRYWLRHVRELDYHLSKNVHKVSACNTSRPSGEVADSTDCTENESGGKREHRALPCRVGVKIRGVEWFIYNRSPSYDAILSGIKGGEETELTGISTLPKEAEPNRLYSTDAFGQNPGLTETEKTPRKDTNSHATAMSEGMRSSSSFSASQNLALNPTALPSFLHLLPIELECSRGAIVLGNQNTRSVLVAKFEGATGRIDARRSRPVDQYKQVIDLELKHPVVEFKHNRDYPEPQVNKGPGFASNATCEYVTVHQSNGRGCFLTRIQGALIAIRQFIPYHSNFSNSSTHLDHKSGKKSNLAEENTGLYGQNRWLGLTRYLDNDDDLAEQGRWRCVEYGEFPTIVDSPKIAISLYWDVPGLIPDSINAASDLPSDSVTDINGGTPPDWAIELKVYGGTISYGPWADRQRNDLQAVFFPTIYKDSVPAVKLKPGQRRVSTLLQIRVEMEDQTTLLVPTREVSKDWRWKGDTRVSPMTAAKQQKKKGLTKGIKRKQAKQPLNARPFGWLEIRVSSDSSIVFRMDLVAGAQGYSNCVNLDLKGLEISSSVNHELLWKSQTQVISVGLSNPLGWKALRRWNIDVHDNGLELFLLRDHTFLIADLVNDWTSGPPGNFHTFVPFEYSINLHCHNFKLYLNANDSNIINNPSDVDDNTFVIVRSQQLTANIIIPSDCFRPARSQVTFGVKASEGGLDLRTSPRNTLHTFLNDSRVASLDDLKIDGSYDFYNETSAELTDILTLNVQGVSPSIDLYGFLIRYFMKIKDNYFGDDIHFRTTEEYQKQIGRTGNQPFQNLNPIHHPRVSNDLDIIFSITVLDACVLLPVHLYSCIENLKLEMPSVIADLRITNYYMDLAVSFSPIAATYRSHTMSDSYSSTQIFVDGLELMGHRLFGLPPYEPTYVCNWDFDVGSITGECSVDFFRFLTMSMKCYALSVDDAENALPSLNPVLIHDVTFLRARIRPVLIGLQVDVVVFLLSTDDTKVHYNDSAGSLFSDHLSIATPKFTVALLDVQEAATGLQGVANTHAYLRTAIEISKVKRKCGFRSDLQLQQHHVALHDSRTHRVPWLTRGTDLAGHSRGFNHQVKPRPPAMPFPSMPEPVLTPIDIGGDGASSVSETACSMSSRTASSRKSTFLHDQFSVPSHRDHQVNNNGKAGRVHCQDSHHHSSSTESTDGVDGQFCKTSTAIVGSYTSMADGFIDHATTPPGLVRSHSMIPSAYKAPYFPLLARRADTRNLPSLPEDLPADHVFGDKTVLESLKSQLLDDGSEQTSFMITPTDGVLAFCTPKALSYVTQFLASLQASDSTALLDSLQVEAMTAILNADERRTMRSQTLNLSVSVPWLSVKFLGDSTPELVDRQKCYKLTLKKVTAAVMRSTQLIDTPAPIGHPKFSVHLRLSQVICSAKETVASQADEQAVIKLSSRDVALWMWCDKTTTADLQLTHVEITSASRKTDYISSLVRQIMIWSEDISHRFANIENQRKARLQLLILLLTSQGQDVPDPPFLTRISSVLRGSSHHLRKHDSWKMISRLRYAQQHLPADNRDIICSQCMQDLIVCPADAADRVTASFNDWRTWDLENARSTRLMRMVYGTSVDLFAPRMGGSTPLSVSFRAKEINIHVEPGPSQNEIVLKRLILGLAMNQPSTNAQFSSSSTLSSPNRPPGPKKSIYQAHLAESVLRLNWSLLDMIGNVIKTVHAMRNSNATKMPNRNLPQSSEDFPHIHVVFSAETSILDVNLPTLQIVTLCRGLKTSVIASSDRTSSRNLLMCVAVEASTTISEVKTASTLLTSYRLCKPRILGSKDDSHSGIVDPPWRFVGSGDEVSLSILADLPKILNVADTFLNHEVVYIRTWVDSLSLGKAPLSSKVTAKRDASLLKAHVALSLDSYFISLVVLPTLVYQIQGTQACSSIRSGYHKRSGIVVEFNLKNHSHVFRAQAKKVLHDLSILHMPPLDGSLVFDLEPSQILVFFRGLIGNILFDASAVHALLTAVGRPEISDLVTDMNQSISTMRNTYKQIFETSQSKPVLNQSQPWLYTAHIVFEGLAVDAKSLESSSVAQAAELQFCVGRVQLKATNQRSSELGARELLDLEIHVCDIGLNLYRLAKGVRHPCGDVGTKAILRSTSKLNDIEGIIREHWISSTNLEVNVFPETGSVIVAIIAHLSDTLKTIDFTREVENLRSLKRVALGSENTALRSVKHDGSGDGARFSAFFNVTYSLEMTNISITWKIGDSVSTTRGREPQNLILSFTKIDLATRREKAARLLVENFQLQLAPASRTLPVRSLDSALLPEVVFKVTNVSTAQDRRLVFQAAGKSLDLRLTSQFILPANDIRRSILSAVQQVHTATSNWNATATVNNVQRKPLLGNRKLASLLIDADFAGAVVFMQSGTVADPHLMATNVLRGGVLPQHGGYNQFTPDNASSSSTTLRAPGVAFKVEYKNASSGEQSLNAEIKVDPSSNTLYPTVVPLIMELSSSVKDIVSESSNTEIALRISPPQSKLAADEKLRVTDPSAILGDCRINLGLRICRQEFSLSCQPIARVAATAHFEDIYITFNTVQVPGYGRFFAVSATFTRLQASVQHSYSRESTGNIEINSVAVCLMNSKHTRTGDGISAAVNISPMKAQINGKQSQDFLLFRDIWMPLEIRHSTSRTTSAPASEPQAFIVQRYQQIAATGAFPWDTNLSIAELDIQLDLGQSLGKSAFVVTGFWVSSKKSSDWEQNLCLGFRTMAVNGTGRMSGFVELHDFRVRTSIQWPIVEKAHSQTPLVQASLTFDRLKVKAAFDFQTFLIADIVGCDFLMYNVRNLKDVSRDRLVGVLEGDKVQVYCTTTSSSQAFALYQAIQRLYQEKLTAYETSLKDIEKLLRRRSSIIPMPMRSGAKEMEDPNDPEDKGSLRLHTTVVVNLKTVNIGAFPNTFIDNQIFKLEALDASARFAIVLHENKIHSTLGMTLGELRIALSNIIRLHAPQALSEVSVADVVAYATGSRGGTILKVPKLLATMETWQSPNSTLIDYVFKSSFQGKVDVGWNYSRISYIRGMWANHIRALAQRLGKPLPSSAVQISGGLGPEGGEGSHQFGQGRQEKITAIVNVPQSKYQYMALQPAIIETPQLRDMAEATPPLEWIGLHRDRLPNLTHQIVIVSLQEVAKEVDDAYSRILGTA